MKRMVSFLVNVVLPPLGMAIARSLIFVLLCFVALVIAAGLLVFQSNFTKGLKASSSDIILEEHRIISEEARNPVLRL